MAEALTADSSDLERMGRAGAASVAEQHDAYTQAKKLADLFVRSNVIADRPSKDTPESRPMATR